jgi:hypothetical protein
VRAVWALHASFHQFVKELAQPPFGGVEHFFAFRDGRILTPATTALPFHLDGEVAFLLQAVQEGVEGAGA